MKKQKKLSLKARDLTPQKNVTGGRHHRGHGSQAHVFVERGDTGLRFGLWPRSPQ